MFGPQDLSSSLCTVSLQRGGQSVPWDHTVSNGMCYIGLAVLSNVSGVWNHHPCIITPRQMYIAALTQASHDIFGDSMPKPMSASFYCHGKLIAAEFISPARC